MKYIELSQQIKNFLTHIEENELDVTSAEVQDTLEGLLSELQDKVNFYFTIRQEAKDNIAFYKSIVEKYTNKIKAEQNRMNFAEERLIDICKNFGDTYVKDENGYNLFSIKTKESEAVIVNSIDKLPEKYLRIKINKEPDKIAIKEAIKKGELIENDNVFIEKRLNLLVK
jgi:hypothetical protein